MQFPDAAIEILRKARWNPNAERHYDVLSGGFYWTDEKLTEVGSICSSQQNWTHREIISFRASIINDKLRTELETAWKHLSKECPDWPGFRPERSCGDLAAELEKASKKALDELDSLMDTLG